MVAAPRSVFSLYHGCAVVAVVLAVAWQTQDVVLPDTYTEFHDQFNALLLRTTTLIDPLYRKSLQHAFLQFTTHGYGCAKAGAECFYLVLSPLVWLMVQFVRAAAMGFYEFCIVRGIASPTAIAQVQAVAAAVWQWQTTRTRRELAWQAAAMAAVVVLYHVLRFLKRRRYLERVKQWTRRKQRAASRIYRGQLRRLAQVSVVLAIMTPHMIFAVVTLAVNTVVLPTFCRWIAVETKFTCVFSTWIPLVATILLLFDSWKTEEEEKRRKEQRRRRNRPAAAAAANTGRSRRKSLVDAVRNNEKNNSSLEDRQEYWIHYWIVRAGVQLFKLFFRHFPFLSTFLTLHPLVIPLLCQTELMFWFWVLLVPKITPTILETYQPFQTPIDFIAVRILGDATKTVYDGFESVVPGRIWEEYIVFFSKSGLNVLGMLGMLSTPTQEILVGLVSQSRSLVLPALLLLIWPLQKYALLFVIWVLPMAQSFTTAHNTVTRRLAAASANTTTRRTSYHWLQTWVLHVLLTLVVNSSQFLLRWIPLSCVPVFLLYAYLSLAPSGTIDDVYRDWIQEELQLVCILPNDDQQRAAPKASKIAALVTWMIEKLPKAKDDDERPENNKVRREYPVVHDKDDENDLDDEDDGAPFVPEEYPLADDVLLQRTDKNCELDADDDEVGPSEEKENSNVQLRRRSLRVRDPHH